MGLQNVNEKSNNSTLVCNGNADLCDLRYDQVTHPGSHNSAAYNLKFDCKQNLLNCKEFTNDCDKKKQKCLASQKARCEAQIDACKQKIPKFLDFGCNIHQFGCSKIDRAFCDNNEAICRLSSAVCDVSKNACGNFPAPWTHNCLFNNNFGHNIATQLNDGIRLFDLDTCLVDKHEAILCHGRTPYRALGDELDPVFKQIRDFLETNPNEIVTIEFKDTDGDISVSGTYIQSKLEQFFIIDPGHSMVWPKIGREFKWPTLREMIEENQRIVIFFGNSLYKKTPNLKPWIQSSKDWFIESFTYSYNAGTLHELSKAFIQWSEKAQDLIKDDKQKFGRVRWQVLDDTIAAQKSDVENSMKKTEKPTTNCIDTFASEVNYDVLTEFSNLFYSKFKYIFRVRVDYYWKGNLFDIVKRLNQLNVERFNKGWDNFNL
ncbi:hypothetical protein G9A89_003431 [Geosiphon pyriformis]|nr:hypothetical protein G9A89_003431 [Geosiphon pyriformis]